MWLQSEDAREDFSSDVKNPDKDGVQIVETSDKLINVSETKCGSRGREFECINASCICSNILSLLGHGLNI